MSKVKQVDDLTLEEIKEVKYFYKHPDGRTILPAEDFLKELKEAKKRS